MNRNKLIASLAGLLLSASAFGAPPVVGAPDLGAGDGGGWKDAWYEARNAMLERNPNVDRDPTSILIQFTPGAREDQKAMMRSIAAGRTLATYASLPGLEHVAVGKDADVSLRALNTLGVAMGVVEYAEPDYILRSSATPNDTYYGLLWGMNNTGQTINGDPGTANADIDANLAWDVSTGTSTVVVGVIDTGIRRTHEDLAANIWSNPGEIAGNNVDDDGNGYKDDTWGWNFYRGNNKPDDDNGHGTHTSGTVGAIGNNAKGVAGVAWNVRLVGLKFLGRNGSGSTSGAIGAIDYCIGKGIRLSNNSWGGPGSSSLQAAVNRAQTAGHLLVVAAGNSAANIDVSPTYPAAYANDNIITVLATDNDNLLASFSNYGATRVDLGAPGVNIASCWGSSNTAYAWSDGTSMACPHVAGAAALVWSVNPSWNYTQVRSKILSTVTPVGALSGRCTTGGLLNANNAVR